jgi:hypothetical protein
MPNARRSRWLPATIALFVTFLIEAWLNVPLSIAPGGIIGLELARTPDAAERIVDVWRAADLVSRARAGVWFDYAYLAAYGWFFREMVLLESWTRSAAVETWFARLPVIAAGFDAVEDIALLMMLGGTIAPPWPMLAAVFASLKFVLLICTAVYLLVGGVVLIARRTRGLK